MRDPYFAILVSDDNDLSYYRTLEGALRGLSDHHDGIVLLYYLNEQDGRIREDDSTWWTWDEDKQRAVKNQIISG